MRIHILYCILYSMYITKVRFLFSVKPTLYTVPKIVNFDSDTVIIRPLRTKTLVSGNKRPVPQLSVTKFSKFWDSVGRKQILFKKSNCVQETIYSFKSFIKYSFPKSLFFREVSGFFHQSTLSGVPDLHCTVEIVLQPHILPYFSHFL
jgi:hypothetical protein